MNALLAICRLPHRGIGPPPTYTHNIDNTWEYRSEIGSVTEKNTEKYTTMGKVQEEKKRPLLMLGTYGRTA